MNKLIKYVCEPLVIIGALNWGLIGAFNFNLVEVLFGTGIITKIVYLLVGLASLCCIYDYSQMDNSRE